MLFRCAFGMLVVILRTVSAHSRFTTLYVNGVNQGEGTCVRMDLDAAKTTFPIASITSTDMTCGVGGLTAVNRTCPLKAGDLASFEYRSTPDGSASGSIAYQHSGPCAVYMKQISGAYPASDPFVNNNPSGDGWFKIFYDGYDESSKKWCTNRLNESAEGVISAVIPTDIASGYYLLRPELLALHAAASEHDPQFYTGCAQVYIDGGSGTAKPTTASIPGYVNMNMPAMTFNVWAQPMALPYPEFGPPVYRSPSPALSKRANVREDSVSAESATPDVFGASVSARNQFGNCPANTILSVGNWCGVELPSYTDSSTTDTTNCWATAKQCWSIGESCWANFGPAVYNSPNGHGSQRGVTGDGPSGCYIWNDRCNDINNSCKSGAVSGPPHQGKVLTPSASTLGNGNLKSISVGVSRRDAAEDTAAENSAPMHSRITRRHAAFA